MKPFFIIWKKSFTTHLLNQILTKNWILVQAKNTSPSATSKGTMHFFKLSFPFKLNNSIPESKTPTLPTLLGPCSCLSAVHTKCIPELFGLPISGAATLLQVPGKQLSKHSAIPHSPELTYGRWLC